MTNPFRLRKKTAVRHWSTPVLLVKVVICQDEGKKRKNIVVPSAAGNACDRISGGKGCPQQG